MRAHSRSGSARTAQLQFSSIGWSEFIDFATDIVDGWVVDLGYWMRDQDRGRAQRWTVMGGEASAADREMEAQPGWRRAVDYFNPKWQKMENLPGVPVVQSREIRTFKF